LGAAFSDGLSVRHAEAVSLAEESEHCPAGRSKHGQTAAGIGKKLSSPAIDARGFRFPSRNMRVV
jgi:hypothetical protein